MAGLPLLPLLLAASTPASAPDWFDRLPACASAEAPIDAPCTLTIRFSPPAVTRLLGISDHVWWIDGDRLTLIGRFGDEGWAALCCAIQTPLEPIGDTGFGAIIVRVPRMREALLDVGYGPSPRAQEPEVVRGPDSPPSPRSAAALRGTITARSVFSSILEEERLFSVYLPPNIVPDARLPVIYLADGNTRRFAPILEAAIAEGRVAPAILVGTHPGYGPATGCVSAPCDRRMLEYLVNANPEGAAPGSVFNRHLRFVTDELVPLIERDYPASNRREDRIAAGYSNGGAWALAAAILRPDLFGNVIAMSAGAQWAADNAAPLGRARVYAGAGLFEPGFLRRTRAAATAAEHAGAEVRVRELVSGHSPVMWEILFAEGAAWLLPPESVANRRLVSD